MPFSPPHIATLVAAATLLCAWAIGRAANALTGVLLPLERALTNVLLGMLALATGALLLGAVGLLAPIPFAVLTAAMLLAATLLARRTGDAIAADPAPPSTAQPCTTPRPRWHAAAAAIALLPLGTLALLPPTFFDPGLYHLPLIRHFALGERLSLATDQLLPTFALLLHLLATVPYQLGGETAVQLLHLATFVCAGLTLLAAGRRLGAPSTGLLAAALWWGQPSFEGNATQVMVDCAWAAFAVQGISLACIAWHTRARPTGLLLLAGALAGASLSTKYIGGITALPVGAIALALCVRTRSAAPAAAALLGGLLASAPFLGWNWLATGDPVFPYLAERIADPLWTADDLRNQRAGWLQFGAGRSLTDALLVPWRLVVDSDTYQTGAPLSPLLVWLGLPFVAVGAVASRTGRLLAPVVALLLYTWFQNSQQLRFLSGPTLAAAWLAAVGFATLRVGPRARLAVALAALATAPAYVGVRLWRDGLPPTDTARRDAFVRAHYPTVTSHWWLADRAPGARVYGLFDDPSRYAATAGRALGWTGGWYGSARFRDVYEFEHERLRPAAEVARTLDDLDCDHLFVARRPGLDLGELQPTAAPDGTARLLPLRADAQGALFCLHPDERARTCREVAVPNAGDTVEAPADSTWLLLLPDAGVDAALVFVDAAGHERHAVRGAYASRGLAFVIGTAPADGPRLRVAAPTGSRLLQLRTAR